MQQKLIDKVLEQDKKIKHLENYIEHQKLTRDEFNQLVKSIITCIDKKSPHFTLQEDIEHTLEDHLDTIYCKTCGSCGEEGCCSPSRCLYGESNAASYNELLEENEKLRIQNEKMVELLYTVTYEGSIRKGEDINKRIWPLHSSTYISIMRLLKEVYGDKFAEKTE